MQIRKLAGIFLVMVMAVAALLPGVQAHDEDTSALRTFGGHVTGIEDEFVAVGIGGDSATIYICDGNIETGTVTIAEWFSGPVSGNKIDVTSAGGHRVEVTIEDTSATGKFTFKDGTVKEFELELLDGSSGLYRSEFTLRDIDFVAGWLVLPDGSVRGAVRDLETGDLDPATFLDFNQIQAADEETGE
jgi:hypothetical protein